MWLVIGLAILAIIIVLVGVWIGNQMLNQRNRIIHAPLHNANDLIDGLSVVEGVAMPLNRMPTAFSQEDAAWCEAKAEQLNIVDGKVKPNSYTTIFKSRTEDPFLVKDNSGYILVNPEGGFFDVDFTFTEENYDYKAGSFHVQKPAAHIRELFDDNDVPYEDKNGPFPIMFTETTIKNGDKVMMIGMRTSDKKEIAELLAGEPEFRPDGIKGVIYHGGPKERELYVYPGSYDDALGSLGKTGRGFIIGGVIAGLVCGGAALAVLVFA